jgi:hypothetical protein
VINGLKTKKQKFAMEIEWLLVGVVVFFQVRFFTGTYKQIQLFKDIIPLVDNFKITKVLVPTSELVKLSPKEILLNIVQYKEMQIIEEKIVSTEINVMECDVSTNHVCDKILYSVNNYLIRNRGGATDFNLIKDIVERNTDIVEEDINLSVGISRLNGYHDGHCNCFV